MSAEIDRCEEWGVILDGRQKIVLWVFQCWLEAAGLDEETEYSEDTIMALIQGIREQIGEEIFDLLQKKWGIEKARIKARLSEPVNQRRVQRAILDADSEGHFLGVARRVVEVGAKVFFNAQRLEVGQEGPDGASESDDFSLGQD